MTRNQISIILYLVGAVLTEEAHQLFRLYPKNRISLFPFDDTQMSVQWYVYDLSNCISAVLIALAIYTLSATRNMKDLALCYVGYRFCELIAFVLWDKQFGYTELLLLFGFVLYVIISQWKKR